MSFTDSVRALVLDGAAVWGFLAALALVLALTPATAWLAPRIGALDDKADRPRVHHGAIPRIGGLAIVAAILLPAAFIVDLDGPYLGIGIGTLCVAAVGLVDDVRGVPPRAKLVATTLIALIPVVGFDLTFDHITLPLIGDHDLGLLSYPLTVLWIVFLANLVNLIDGMDSLAAGIVAIAALSFALLAASFGRADAAALAAIICGATLGFLRHNYHPAKIFMGDSGALSLGAALAVTALITGQVLILPLIGIIFVAEAGSVLIQVAAYRLTGRRVFRMSPIHHHFELAGWDEEKITMRFWIVGVLAAMLGVVLFLSTVHRLT